MNQNSANFLERFMLLQDLKVARRLYQDKKGLPINELNKLPVGVATAAFTKLALLDSEGFKFDESLFNVLEDNAESRKKTIEHILTKADINNFTQNQFQANWKKRKNVSFITKGSNIVSVC
jgi:hypothetical protein